jgi:hypothetical protein
VATSKSGPTGLREVPSLRPTSWAWQAALLTVGFICSVFAQGEPVPFTVSNPKHKKWSSEEAGKIYYSACELLARTFRPEKPPRLHSRFLLVLGANDDQVLRTDTAVEIHLNSWE